MERLTGWRKIAAAIWGPSRDPQIYGAMELDATKLTAFMAYARAAGCWLGSLPPRPVSRRRPAHLPAGSTQAGMRPAESQDERFALWRRRAPRPMLGTW